MVGMPGDGLGGTDEQGGDDGDMFSQAASEVFLAAKRDDEPRFARALKNAIDIAISKYDDEGDSHETEGGDNPGHGGY